MVDRRCECGRAGRPGAQRQVTRIILFVHIAAPAILPLVGVAIQDQGQGVSGARQVNGSGGLRCNVQGASKVADLLHLGRVDV